MDVPSTHIRIERSERRPARGARRVGPCEPNEKVTVTIVLRRNPSAPPLPSQQKPAVAASKAQRRYSREEFASTFGATQADIDKVSQFAHAFHLTIEEASSAKRTVVVSGTAENMSNAFAVELSRYELPGHTYRGRDGFVHVPKDLAAIITGVLGLDNRRVVRHHSVAVRGVAAPAAAPVGAVPLTPPQVAKLYNFPDGPAAGQTIGILEFGGGFVTDPVTNRATDVDTFCANLGLQAPTVTAIPVLGVNNSPMGSKTDFWVDDPAKTPSSDTDVEVALDLEIIAAIAQGAKLAVYFAPNSPDGFFNAVQTAVQDPVNHPDVLSISWGGSELNDWSPMDIDNVSSAFEDAFNVGISVFVSSGDDGSDCGVGDGLAHVEYPGTDKWVVCCGGTVISNVAGSTFNEGTWNDSGATGGGISDHFDPQTWQAEAGIPPSVNPGGRLGRGVPDVAGNASPTSGYDLWLYGTQFSKLVVTSGADLGQSGFIEGGTSAVAPLYAALTALINSALGKRCPFLNPVLYGLNGTSTLRDINDGQNNQWSSEAKPAPSYTSGPGWDGCTGLGSIDGKKLLAALKNG
jgi:kumamolisin